MPALISYSTDQRTHLKKALEKPSKTPSVLTANIACLLLSWYQIAADRITAACLESELHYHHTLSSDISATVATRPEELSGAQKLVDFTSGN